MGGNPQYDIGKKKEKKKKGRKKEKREKRKQPFSDGHSR